MTAELPESKPWHVGQSFEAASSYQIRDEVEELVRRDLLGPWDGDDEQLPRNSAGPLERYLVGRLGPRHLPNSVEEAADELPDNDLGAAGDAREAELTDQLTIQNAGRLWASSMGLSFTVSQDIDTISATVEFGQYHLTEAEDEQGVARRTWERGPFRRDLYLRLDGETSQRFPLVGDDTARPSVHLRAEIRGRQDTARRKTRVVQLTLINAQDEPKSNRDTAWILQPRITVTAPDKTSAIFLPIDDLGTANEEPEDRHLRLLYRDHLRYAWGHNVAVHAEATDGERRAHTLTTTWIPAYEVPATVAPRPEDSPYLDGLELSMDALAKVGLDTLRTGLSPLAGGYRAWLDNQERTIGSLPASLQQTAQDAISTARQAADRIQAGIDLLTTASHPHHQTALDAFRFANEAMALQRRHTAVAALRAEQQNVGYPEAMAAVDKEGPAAASWRPFQLAFVLLNLPSLTDPEHPERAANSEATVDLLFFPTGGGKTEAYLGLAAYTFAIRRLQDVLGTGADARSGAGGVAVLMRYTLRLLTAQQFQRAAALVCAAEILRTRAYDSGDRRWGREPFRIGLWVGSSVSPNWYNDAAAEVSELKESGGRYSNRVLQTLSCPWCGTKLEGYRDLHTDTERRRILVRCPNVEGENACPFSTGDGLPILTVDEEIYRYAPSLVIATVDKLAQLPWRGYAGILFGRVNQRCPRHGFRHDDLDTQTQCGSRHRAKGKFPAVESQPHIRLRPPDLIIQDELHLISGALGTVVGLFEAAVDQLCTWQVGDHLVGPKIVASTATTKRAASQVLGVFGRDLAVFPPPVLDIKDTFFSRQVPVTPKRPGRRYIGLCAHGVRLKSAEIRLAEILLLVGQTMFDKYGEPADPYLTMVGYFNATRELAGMRRYLDDDVTTRVRSRGRPRGLSNRIASATGMLTVQELTSRISSADVSTVLKRLEVGFDPELDTTAARQAMYGEYTLARAEHRDPIIPDRDFQRMPVDVVLATSMLQVGVDVSRFGLMVVAGQPKNTAEYIQASSRVGRDLDRPGLVVALYNWSRPRDLAHFEDFEHYHATFYRQVEALSVTPYTRRALDRGTAATFVAAVRNLDDSYSRDADAQAVPLDSPLVRAVKQRLLDRAEAIAGERGRAYLADRLKAVSERWELKKDGNTRLGYRQRTSKQERLRGLLDPAGSGDWSELTVAQSMRETENEINLLLPGSGLFDSVRNQPAWSFAPPDEDPRPEDNSPVADELGVSDPDTRKAAR